MKNNNEFNEFSEDDTGDPMEGFGLFPVEASSSRLGQCINTTSQASSYSTSRKLTPMDTNLFIQTEREVLGYFTRQDYTGPIPSEEREDITDRELTAALEEERLTPRGYHPWFGFVEED